MRVSTWLLCALLCGFTPLQGAEKTPAELEQQAQASKATAAKELAAFKQLQESFEVAAEAAKQLKDGADAQSAAVQKAADEAKSSLNAADEKVQALQKAVSAAEENESDAKKVRDNRSTAVDGLRKKVATAQQQLKNHAAFVQQRDQTAAAAAKADGQARQALADHETYIRRAEERVKQTIADRETLTKRLEAALKLYQQHPQFLENYKLVKKEFDSRVESEKGAKEALEKLNQGHPELKDTAAQKHKLAEAAQKQLDAARQLPNEIGNFQNELNRADAALQQAQATHEFVASATTIAKLNLEEAQASYNRLVELNNTLKPKSKASAANSNDDESKESQADKPSSDESDDAVAEQPADPRKKANPAAASPKNGPKKNAVSKPAPAVVAPAAPQLQNIAVAAVPGGKAPKVFPLIFGFSRDFKGIGPGVSVSAQGLKEELKKSFTEGIDMGPILTVGLDPFSRSATDQLNVANVFNTIKQVKQLPGFKSDSTIVCFFLCHGGHATGLDHAPQWEYGNFFQLESRENLARSDLFEALLDLRGTTASERASGLTVLISETCNTSVDLGVAPPQISPAAADPKQARLLNRLLTTYTGQVSVSSTSPHELGFYDSQKGGFFISSLLKTLDTSEDKDWGLVIEAAARGSSDKFLAAFPDPRQYLSEYGHHDRDKNGNVTLLYSMTAKWMRSKSRVKLVP